MMNARLATYSPVLLAIKELLLHVTIPAHSNILQCFIDASGHGLELLTYSVDQNFHSGPLKLESNLGRSGFKAESE
jgi:hypothetical protein